MKNWLPILLLSLVMSCSGKKQIEKAVHSGNYDLAIENALKKLENNKNKERKQDYVMLLENAYIKATERNISAINHLKKDNNPNNYKGIYDNYIQLQQRQELIKPFLPLQIKGKPVDFNFREYADEIAHARQNYSEQMYKDAKNMLQSKNKFDLRRAYETFEYIQKINPNYKNVSQLMDEAYNLGTDYVIVTIENQTDQIIPQRLENDLLNFDTYGLDQFWTVYHAIPSNEINYDYAMALQLKRINISPERIKEKEIIREKKIVDGWKYQLDRKGNVKKDSLGNDIKIDKIVQVQARFHEYYQQKSTQVLAEVVYIDIKENRTLRVFPITSEFIFENIYGRFDGDDRALNKQDLDILRGKRVPFPSDEDMVYDTGEDLKLKLKQIIKSYKF